MFIAWMYYNARVKVSRSGSASRGDGAMLPVSPSVLHRDAGKTDMDVTKIPAPLDRNFARVVVTFVTVTFIAAAL